MSITDNPLCFGWSYLSDNLSSGGHWSFILPCLSCLYVCFITQCCTSTGETPAQICNFLFAIAFVIIIVRGRVLRYREPIFSSIFSAGYHYPFSCFSIRHEGSTFSFNFFSCNTSNADLKYIIVLIVTKPWGETSRQFFNFHFRHQNSELKRTYWSFISLSRFIYT